MVKVDKILHQINNFNKFKNMSEENTVRNLALKIVSDYKRSTEEKTNNLLRLNAISHSNLGTDSTKAEKKKVKTDSRFIFNEVKKLNKDLGGLLITHMD